MDKSLVLLFQILFLLSGSKYIYSQDEYFSHYNEKISAKPYEKIYLHTDRDIYSIKDDIWFKIYLLDGKNHFPAFGINTVYVDLVDSDGETLIHKPYLIEEGTGRGNFNIPDSLWTGVYTIYAYTNYLKNFGISSFFKKEITISHIQLYGEDSISDNKVRFKQLSGQKKSMVNMQFMPEGGYLANDIFNVLAYKITGMNGKGLNQKGVIKDKDGNFIDSLQTTHLGMGKILFQPHRTLSYYAVLDDFPADTFFLPSAYDRPIMQYLGIVDSMVQLRICRLYETASDNLIYLVIKSKGEIIFYLEKDLNMVYTRIYIHRENFRPGLNQLILMDKNFTPLAERLFFIPGDSLVDMSIRVNKELFRKREKTEISLKINNEEDIQARGSYSMSVINLDHVALSGIPSESIISYLELESEIRGEIENPGYYFSSPYGSIKENLDLLLLTQGWTEYIWNSELTERLDDFEYSREEGLTISGHAQRLILNRALNEGNIILFVPAEFIFLETTTDSSGYFQFENLILHDSTKILLHSKDKNNRSNTKLIDANCVIQPSPYFPGSEYNTLHDSLLDLYNAEAYGRYLSNSYFNFDKDHILLDEVTVIGQKKEKDDGHYRIYSQASNVIDMDEYPNVSYTDLFTFLSGRVAGLFISGDNISIRGAQSPPLILLDGIEIDASTARNIPLEVVDKIEILKDAANTAIFGMRGGNGVIAIYTRRGEIIYTEKTLFDIISKTIEAYAVAKNFYSPDFSNSDTRHDMIDQRATLFWEPDLVFDPEGNCYISFFNSDDSGKIGIIVQGITYLGKPCFSGAYYFVSGK